MADAVLLHDHVGIPRALMCTTCTGVYELSSPIAASECCNPELRRKNEEFRMDEAQRAHDAAELELIAKAKLISSKDFTGPVMVPALNERGGVFFKNIDRLIEYYDSEPKPPVIWCCYERKFELPQADELIQREVDDQEHYDGIEDALTSTDEIDAAILAWNALQTAGTWFPDYHARVQLEGYA